MEVMCGKTRGMCGKLRNSFFRAVVWGFLVVRRLRLLEGCSVFVLENGLGGED